MKKIALRYPTRGGSMVMTKSEEGEFFLYQWVIRNKNSGVYSTTDAYGTKSKGPFVNDQWELIKPYEPSRTLKEQINTGG